MLRSRSTNRYTRTKTERRQTTAYYLLLVCFCISLFVTLLVLFVTTLKPVEDGTGPHSGSFTPETYNLDPQTNKFALPIPEFCNTRAYRRFPMKLMTNQNDDELFDEKTIINNVDVWTGDVILYNQSVVFGKTIVSITPSIVFNAQQDEEEIKNMSSVVDGTGLILTAGIVDMHSHLGVYPWPLDLTANHDGNEASQPVTPQVRVVDAFNPHDPAIKQAMEDGGITTAQILPGSANVIGGEGLIVKLIPGSLLDNMISPAAQDTVVLKMACGENPKRNYGNQGKMPMTRMGNMWLMRQKLQQAKNLVREKDKWCERVKRRSRTHYDSIFDGDMPHEPGLETLTSLFTNSSVSLNIHCYTVGDIQAMIRIANEFNITVSSFHHALEAYQIPEILKRSRVGVSMFADSWGYKYEAYRASVHAPRILKDSGVDVAINTDHPEIFAGDLVYEAAKSWHYGMAEQDAFRSITHIPAKMIHLSNFIGKVGKSMQSDIVLWNKHPFYRRSRPKMVWIDGKLQTQREVQTDNEEVNPFELRTVDATTPSMKKFLRSVNQSTLYAPYDVENENLKISRNEYFRMARPTYNIRVSHFDEHKEIERRSCRQGERDVMHDIGTDHAIVIRNVDLFDMNSTFFDADRNTFHEMCDIGIVRGSLDCIVCRGKKESKYDTSECEFKDKEKYSNRVEFIIEPTVDSSSIFRPILTVSFVASGGTGSHLGQIGINAEKVAHDGPGDNVLENRAKILTQTGIRFRSKHLAAAWFSGVNVAITVPEGDKFIAGHSVAFSTQSRNINRALISTQGSLHVNLGNMAKSNDDGKNSETSSISGQFTILEKLLRDADTSLKQLEDPNDISKMNVWQKVIMKRVALSVNVHQSDQIVNLINLKVRYGFDLIIIGASEAHLVADEIELSGSTVILSPLECHPDHWERRRCDWKLNIKSFMQKKIPFAVGMVDHSHIRELRWQPSKLLDLGVSYEQALSTISSQVSRVFRLPLQYQQMVIGKRANLVMFDNDPLSLTSNILLNINGHFVTCHPRQN